MLSGLNEADLNAAALRRTIDSSDVHDVAVPCRTDVTQRWPTTVTVDRVICATKQQQNNQHWTRTQSANYLAGRVSRKPQTRPRRLSPGPSLFSNRVTKRRKQTSAGVSPSLPRWWQKFVHYVNVLEGQAMLELREDLRGNSDCYQIDRNTF